MIQVTRSLVRDFRAVCKRLLCGRSRKVNPTVQFESGPTGLFLRSVTFDGAVQYHVAGELPVSQFAVPLSTLAECEGKSAALVSFDPKSQKNVTLTWDEGRIPRQHSVSQDKWDSGTFPATPTAFTSNPAELLTALQDASQTTDNESSRYALGHLQLDGRKGQIAATDGKHLLIQTGFQFPWQEALLVPGSNVYGSSELQHEESVGVARSEKWLSLSAGPWLIHLPIDKDGRFPRIDDIVPREERIASRLQIAADDAEFLNDAIRRLPEDEAQNHPITLDLNGEVLIRASASDQPQPTELVLSNSRLVGDPVQSNINREYLARAVRLGFREVGLINADGILTCRDSRRTYLWMPLSKEGAVKHTANCVRIESQPSASVADFGDRFQSTPPETTHPPMNRISQPSRQANNDNAGGSSSTQVTSSDKPKSSIELALTLRDTLRVAASQANDLAKSLKRQRRESQLVKATLASLEQLQRAAA